MLKLSCYAAFDLMVSRMSSNTSYKHSGPPHRVYGMFWLYFHRNQNHFASRPVAWTVVSLYFYAYNILAGDRIMGTQNNRDVVRRERGFNSDIEIKRK